MSQLNDDDLDFGVTLDNGEQQTERKIQTMKNKVNMYQGQPEQTTLRQSDPEGLTIASSDFNFNKSSHPIACLFTITFKSLALFFYLIVAYILPPVLTFIIVIIFGSLDFWVVKNISGRLLVGLRWWSVIDQKGNQVWKYESRNNEDCSNSTDKLFFWGGQIIATLLWAIFTLANCLSVDLFQAWLSSMLFLLSATNLYGYYKCRGEYSKKLSKLKTKGILGIAKRFL